MVKLRERPPVEFDVTVKFTYVFEPLDDDPDNPWLLADQERHEIYMQVRDIPCVEPHSISVDIEPTET